MDDVQRDARNAWEAVLSMLREHLKLSQLLEDKFDEHSAAGSLGIIQEIQRSNALLAAIYGRLARRLEKANGWRGDDPPV